MASKRRKGKPAPSEKAESQEMAEGYRGSLGLPEGEEDRGMQAVEPIETTEMPYTLSGIEAPASTFEGGMGAVEPVLQQEEILPMPGLPVEEISLPDAQTSMRGAPLFSADAFLLPGLNAEPLDKRVSYRMERIGIGLFLYELAWGALFVGLLFLALGAQAFTGSKNASDLPFLLGSMVWGGLGGVLGGLYALVKHISWKRDFDRQYLMWYLIGPVAGIIAGAVVYALLWVVLITLTGLASANASPLLFYFLAWLMGYQQDHFTGFFRRLWRGKVSTE